MSFVGNKNGPKKAEYNSILKEAEQGIENYLTFARNEGLIDEQLYNDANRETFSNLQKCMLDPYIDHHLPLWKKGIERSIKKHEWVNIVNAFRQTVRFGTGGIRGMMASNKESIIRLKEEGIDAPILKGTNTINDLVFLLTSVGVARFGQKQEIPFKKVVIGYDSRIRGFDLAALVAKLFLAYDYTVYFFDAPCPYPEVTFAIPYKDIKADVGILISASHNDYRYNGYKLSCANGSQFDPEQRDQMYNEFIATAEPSQIKTLSFSDAPADKLWFLGGENQLPEFDYAGKEDNLINLHRAHQEHVESFLLTKDLESLEDLQIAYCAFHGVGNKAVPRLLKDVGFRNVVSIESEDKQNCLNELDGLFPSFCSDPGHEQQPDPGDPRAAEIAVNAYKDMYKEKKGKENEVPHFDKIDILIGTDPDADRCGVVVKVPQNQQHLYGKDYHLLPADDMWALILRYHIQMDIEEYGQVQDADKKFVVLSNTTSDSITRLAEKYGIGVVRTWVGFASLSAATRDVWENKEDAILDLNQGRNSQYTDLCHPFVCDCQDMENHQRTINIGAMEQSNGFSILGGPPEDNRSLGAKGHVRDKDGTFAALLVAEVAAWAKRQGKSIIDLLDEKIYLDPEIGLFVSSYEPDPLDGEYPGIEGDRRKKTILRRALGYYQLALTGDLEFAGQQVKSACIYRTGKYDEIYPPTHDFQFPDEGIRFFLHEDEHSHVTIRPSGTGNSLRFHIQLWEQPDESNLIHMKRDLRLKGRAIMDDLRKKLGAPRD